jgi:hypothetical protein
MRSGYIGLADLLLGVVGLAVLIYGDIATNKILRLTGFIAVTVCVVAAAILAAFRNDDP